MKRNSFLAVVLSLVMLIGITAPVETFAATSPAELVSGEFGLPLEYNGEPITSWEASGDGVIEIDNTSKKAIVKKYDVDKAIDTSILVTTESGTYSIPYKVCYLPDGEKIFSEDFDGETYSGSVTSSYFAHLDDQLVLTKEAGTTSEVKMIYYFAKGYSGKKILEFDAYFDTDNLSAMRMQIGTSKAMMELRFKPDMFEVSTDGRNYVQAESGNFDFSQKTRVKILADSGSQTYSVWCNGQPAVRDFKYREVDTYFDRIAFFMASTAATAYGSAYLDNIAVYDVVDVMSGIDSNEINNGITTGVATYDLTLPADDGDENSVTWTEADRYIKISGNRGRIHGSPDEQVKSGVVANLLKDGITYMKTYSYTLPKSTLPVPVLGENPVYDEDFEGVSSLDNLRSNTNYSVSDDSKLKINILAQDSNYMETGMYGTYITFPEHEVADTLVYEFELLCPNKGNNQLFIGAGYVGGATRAKSNVLFSLTNAVYATSGTTSGNDGTKLGAYNSANRNLGIVMEMKSEGTWSLWIDGYRWVNNYTMKSALGENELKDMRILTFMASSGTVTSDEDLVIDNLKVYRGSTPKAEVDSLLNNLTSFDGLESGKLSVAGSGDSEITYSDTSDYVAKDGTVTYPMWADNTNITANVFYGGYSASKTLSNVTIPSNFIVGGATSGVAEAGKPLTATLNIAARNPGSKATVIVGVYGSNGTELIGVGVESDASLEAGEVTVSTGILPDDTNETVVKVFVLDSMSSISPIVAPVTPAGQ